MAQWSALEILEQATSELGLVVPTSIPGDTVQDSQMLAMLNAAGAELVYAYPWSNLIRTWKFTTVAGQEEYNIPDDYAYLLNQTTRNASQRAMLRGPDSTQRWAMFRELPASGATRYRIVGRKFQLKPKPVAADNLELDYITENWVLGNKGIRKPRVGMGSDQVMHDAWLLVKFLKFKYLDLKGLGTEGVQNEFNALLMLHIGKDRGNKVLSLVPRPETMYIGGQSIPQGNWIP